MEARQLVRIMRIPIAQRADVLAEGLTVLVEHVDTLTTDLAMLQKAGRARSGAAIGIQAEEEAAKALILLDLVRMGWGSQSACNRQIERFYDHLARGIYAETVEMRPASFGELRQLVDLFRRSRYLDGPNDVDWVFRNQIRSRREESLYVDYLGTDEGDRWVTPASRDSYGTSWRPAAPRLVLALARTGVMTSAGLDIVRMCWRGKSLDDETHWAVASAINAEVCAQLDGIGLSSAASDADRHRLLDEWTFPMGGLEMAEVKVSDAELTDQRDAWLAAQL